MTKHKAIAGVFAALGGLTIGAGLLAQQSRIGDAAQQSRRPGQPSVKVGEPASPASKALIEARRATAREIFQSEMQRHETTIEPPADDLSLWSRRWMDEELRLRTDPAARLTAIVDHLERVKRLEQIAVGIARTGQGRHSSALKARYFRLEAEQMLAEARGTSGNRPISSPASRPVGENSAPPPTALPK